jgi:hypothetical protein
MAFEDELSKWFMKLPDLLQSLLLSIIVTVAAYLFVYFAKALYTIPVSFDLPWLLVFVLVFLALLVRKRIRIMRADAKPALK